MSQPAVSWVIANSPYYGPFFTIHIVIADTVDDNLELRVSQRWLAKRAKSSRHTVDNFLAVALKDGCLEVSSTAAGNRMTNYRLVMPAGPPDRGARVARNGSQSSGARVARNGNHRSVRQRRSSGAQVALGWRAMGTTSGAEVAHIVRNASSSFASTSPTRARERSARLEPGDATRPKKRDRSNSKDPLAARLADVIGAPYAAALTEVEEWRSIGISDIVIDEATGYAAEHEGRTLAYVGTIAFDWMTQRDPGWVPAPPAPAYDATDDHGDDHGDHAGVAETGVSVGPPLWVGDGISVEDLRWQVGPRRRPEPAALGQLGTGAERDPLADLVYFAADDATYDDALAAVANLRASGVTDDTIRWAAAKAGEVGGSALGYVEAVARTRAGPAAESTNGGCKVIDLTGEAVS